MEINVETFNAAGCQIDFAGPSLTAGQSDDDSMQTGIAIERAVIGGGFTFGFTVDLNGQTAGDAQNFDRAILRQFLLFRVSDGSGMGHNESQGQQRCKGDLAVSMTSV